MNIILIGPQGCGKSLHSQKLSYQYQLQDVDIGALIRQHANKSSPKAKIIDRIANKKGSLLPDGVVIDILIDLFDHSFGYEHLILNGFPRTLNQYQALQNLFRSHNTSIDLAIYLHLQDQLTIDRVLARNRPDDNPQAIAQRLEEFHRHTKPILEQMHQHQILHQIDASAAIDDVHAQIISSIDKINPSLPPHRQLHSTTSSSPAPLTPDQAKPSSTPDPHTRFLYILTHSESDYNQRHIFTGRIDSKLTQTGIDKAKIAAKILKNHRIDVAYRTSLTRTKQTLDQILEFHPDTKVEIDDRFIERDYGNLSTQSKDQFAQDHPDLYPIYHRSYDIAPPGGESMVTVEKRVLPALHEVITRIKKEKINILIVAHGNSIRPIRRYFEKLTTEEMMKLEHLRHQIFTYPISV